MYDDKFLPKLSQNLLEILEDNEFYDVTIEVGNDPYVKIFRSHMIILNYRSSYLRRILSTNVNKKNNDGILVHIKLPNILPEIFQMILRYIYGGRLSLEEYDTSDIIKILIAANELSLQELITHLQSFLIENKKNWMEQNFNLIYKTSFENDSFSKLQNFCTELISNEPEKIFNSIDFISLSEKSLISLIQYDNFQINVIEVWENVLKWGIAQNPGLPSDLSSYSKDDFNILKNTLQQFIPFIKFFNLNHKEFLNKVYPYKKIIPKDLRENLIKHFIDQSDNSKLESKIITKEISSKSIDSRIITSHHAELISKWIDKLENTDKMKNLYEFKLILRGSRDGFSPRKFHEICDYKSHTISIIKVTSSNEILGGYNPTMWKSGLSFGNTKDSFIFSFKNKKNVEENILSRVKDKNLAICNDPDFGPVFGGYEFCLPKDNILSIKRPVSYESISEVGRFSVEEFEVFQIIKD
ncbi:carbohydrate-binding module family 13 protein [Rhizophagus irregularis DAOM 181602=DAOM 197198]|nr:carbohydrate-binding module family 13 protein [Rhizophagus irregularis DAOM 181602=DAOM 197198]